MNDSQQRTSFDRRQAFFRCHANAALWGIGNGLTSTTLMFYLALDFGAEGLLVSLIVASPHLFGVLRLGTPWLLKFAGDRVRFTIVTFAVSNLLLLALPLLTLTGVLRSSREVLPAIVILWAAYHLFEYLGVVSLWSYFRDLAPRRIRGRFLGVRERAMLAGQVIGMLSAGLFSYYYRGQQSSLRDQVKAVVANLLTIELPSARWVGLALPALFGALFMLASIVPLFGLPRLKRADATAYRLADVIAPLADARFRWLLAFIIWFGLCNGLTQTAQALYPYRVLEVSALFILSLRSIMVVGQSLAAPMTGKLIDRIGNRPVMIVSVLIVAGGPLCYLFARYHIVFFVLAWLLWIAYVGLNIGLPNMTWKLSGKEKSASYLAVYLAAAGLAYAIGTIIGGVVYDSLGTAMESIAWLDEYAILFFGGWLLRTAGAIWLWMIDEPATGSAPSR